MTLNDLMEFGHVVRSDGNGNVTDDAPDMLANEVVYLLLDDDGQSLDDDVMDLYPGWTLLSGFTGQHGYNGPVMHQSEFVGGGLETHIRDNEGFYVAIVVDGMYDDATGERETEPVGWAVAFKAIES